jgi:hemoglobin-like flavoprotein
MSTQTTPLPFPLVQATWAKAMTLEGDQAFGHNFYKNLFTDHPSLKETLFKTASIENQKKNLPKSITTVLGMLGDLPKALEALAQLGMRHVYYDTPDAGYAVVGANLIKTLAQILGSDFTEESKKEWLALYAVIEKTMIDAAHSDRAIPHWRRLYKRRATEFKQLIFDSADSNPGKFSQSVSIITKCNFSSVLESSTVIDAVIEQQSTAPIRAAGARLAAEGKTKKEHLAALADAIANNISGRSSAATPYEKLSIDWFVSHLQAGFEGKPFDDSPLGKSEAAAASSSKQNNTCCSSINLCSVLTVGSIVAAVGVAAFFLLKKK